MFYTMERFKGLERNANGDLINLSDHVCFLSEKQRNLLSSDDWSRCIEMDEEIKYLMLEFLKG